MSCEVNLASHVNNTCYHVTYLSSDVVSFLFHIWWYRCLQSLCCRSEISVVVHYGLGIVSTLFLYLCMMCLNDYIHINVSIRDWAPILSKNLNGSLYSPLFQSIPLNTINSYNYLRNIHQRYSATFKIQDFKVSTIEQRVYIFLLISLIIQSHNALT